MGPEVLARIAVRLLAIWILVEAVSGLASIGGLDPRVIGYAGALLMAIVAVATQAAIAVVIWRATPWVVQRVLAGGPADAPHSVDGSAFRMAQAGVGVVGVVMLSSAIPQALWFAGALVASRIVGPSPLAGQPAYDAQMGLYTVGGIANGISVFTRLLIGAFLVARAERVALSFART
jgi:hypothetical protein